MTDDYEDVPDADEKPAAPKREKRAPAKPSETLGQRRALAHRTFKDLPRVTSERLRAHAEKYGTDQIAETGAEAGMDEEQLTNLIASLDRINATFRRDPKRKHLYRTPLKTTPGYRARQLLGIDEPEPLAKPSQSGSGDDGTVTGRGASQKEGKDGRGARTAGAGTSGRKSKK